MGDWTIRTRGLSKSYRIGEHQRRHKTLGEAIAAAVRAPAQRLAAVLRGQAATLTSAATIWALRDVTFEVPHGQAVGVIGRNGAGKTTLLKVLSRITNPTEGHADIRGRVGSLLEVGTGFHPELTGRENIYLSAAILGMKRVEIAARLDSIVAFAEVERFVDTPAKHYSSGMYLRLAFSVAAHLEPDILLIDEVLAVGDASFQRKCLGKIGDVTQQGRTVLFVSHNMEAIQRLRDRCLWIEGGRIAADGLPTEVVSSYLRQWRVDADGRYRIADDRLAEGDGRTVLLEAGILDAHGRPCDSVRFGEPFSVAMKWRQAATSAEPTYALRLYNTQDRLLFAANSVVSQIEDSGRAGTRWVNCRFEHNALVPGDYSISIGCYVRPDTTLHAAERCLAFAVLDVPYREEHTYTLVGAPLFAPETHWSSEPL